MDTNILDELHLLAKGPPKVAEIPVKSKQSPKALVKLARPSNSTNKIERNDAKQAAGKEKKIGKLMSYCTFRNVRSSVCYRIQTNR